MQNNAPLQKSKQVPINIQQHNSALQKNKQIPVNLQQNKHNSMVKNKKKCRFWFQCH